jgi:1-aminocyclopropane-1-carboxylate deaminase/D-cysteine desulfhydrase-like pyridoxal-dependent ACC family enzyme
MKISGLLFDTIDISKGFYIMMNTINRERLQSKIIIFWHTGGLMNMMK